MQSKNMPLTGIHVCPLVEGGDINDPTNNARLILDTYFQKLKQQDGFLNYYVGMQVQNPGVLESIISENRPTLALTHCKC